MDPKSRFYKCESEGFPAVSVYDYETNIPTRGVDNRQFRWEEVSVQAIYQLQEATKSGSFESNTFRADTSVTNATGVNFISTNNSNSTSYRGWTVTGNRTVYIGISGIFVSTGDLSGVTSSFQAHPLDGDEAIGLYLYSGSSLYPSLISTNLAVGAEGPMIIGNNHQIFLQAKLNYGSAGSIKVYPRGWVGGAVGCYYDAINYEWITTVPTGSFAVDSNLTTVKYQFDCSTFPSLTPTGFDLVISSASTGSFITVDNVHLDVLMRKNAFIDALIPTGYMIQITPDLGWHNVLDMFESTSARSNPHLKLFGPYDVELGNLTDNLDNTVTATIDESDFVKATRGEFSKYLWRALPLSPNGTLGVGGLPQKFKYVGNIVNTQFTVDSVIQNDHSSTKIITGSRSSTMTVLVNDEENYPGLSYPSATTWKVEIILSVPYKTFSFRGKEPGGATSAARYVKLSNKLYEENSQALWNVFDEHGLIADIPRLPNESNYEYSIRIKDSYKNRGGPSFVGVVNGGTRELGISKTSDGLILSIPKNEYGTSRIPGATVTVTSYSIRISSPSFLATERLLLDPVHKTCDLTYMPADVPEFAEIDVDGPVALNSIAVEYCCDDTSLKYRYKITTDTEEKFIQVKYAYYIELLFKNYPTLHDLVDAISALKNQDGTQLLDIKISGKLSGSEDSLGLLVSTADIKTTEPTNIAWSPFILKRISDRGYRDYFIKNADQTVKNSEYYSYVKELKNGTKIFWGSVETDRSRWDAADSKSLSMDSIPTQFDPPMSHMTSMITGSEVRMDPIEAWGRGYIGYNNEYLRNAGLNYSLFQPGVGHTNDLTPAIFFTTSSSGISSNGSSLAIGPIKNNNNVVIFSGQV